MKSFLCAILRNQINYKTSSMRALFNPSLYLHSRSAFLAASPLRAFSALGNAVVPEPRKLVRSMVATRDAPETASTSGRPPRPDTTSIPDDVIASIRAMGPLNKEGKLIFKGLTYPQVERLVQLLGEDIKKAKTLFRWVYGDRLWLTRWEDATGSPFAMNKRFLAKLDQVTTLDAGLQLFTVARASDGTRKIIFKLTEGPGAGKTIESVVIPMKRRNRTQGANAGLEGQPPIEDKPSKDRYTLCVSSQVGCAMNCGHCYTGRMGLLANLLPSQIVGQLVEAKRILAQEGDPVPLSHVVYMGMGEPFHNYEAVRSSLRILTEPQDGLRLSGQNVTVSTVGLVPEIERFVREERSLLAISLHATSDEIRNWVIPMNRKYSLEVLMGTLKKHFPRQPEGGGKPKEFCIIEFTMMKGVNDSLEDAARLVKLLDGIYCMVNLIHFNAHPGSPQFHPSPIENMLAFRAAVSKAGIVCTIRESKGNDEMAACGQLGDLASSPRPVVQVPPPRGELRERFGVNKPLQPQA